MVRHARGALRHLSIARYALKRLSAIVVRDVHVARLGVHVDFYVVHVHVVADVPDANWHLNVGSSGVYRNTASAA